MKRVKWIFNPWMLWGAGLGFVILPALGRVIDARDRREFGEGVFMLALGVWVWVVVAKHARKADAKADYLSAQVKTLTAYQHAFALAVGRPLYEEVASKAELSPAYQSAKATEQVALIAYAAASRATEADTT